MKFYIGVNSDNTAIIANTPIVRFYSREDADKKGLPCSYSDTQRPPHWIVDHTEDAKDKDSPKFGWADIGNYMGCNKAFAETIIGRPLTWEDDAVIIELEDNFIEVKPQILDKDIEYLKDLLEKYD